MAWQEELLEQLRISEQPGGLVHVEPFGSVAAALHDSWSDLDVRLFVASGAVGAFFPEYAWLERFGRVYCVQQSVATDHCALRVVFEDLRRVDLMIVEPGTRLDQARWQAACELVQADRARDKPGDGFWLDAVDAVIAVVRDDLLVAAKLALDLSRQCVEVALRLRDAEGRPIGNEWVAHVLAENASLSEPSAILDHILTSATFFEGLQRMANRSYLSRRRPLDDLVHQARASTAERGAYRPRALHR